MTTILAQAVRRSRQDRQCWICNETITAGEPHVAQSCVEYAEAYTVRAHEECQALLDLGDFIEDDDCATIVGDNAVEATLGDNGPEYARATVARISRPDLRARLTQRYPHLLEEPTP